ncbi:MAG: F0F1 ATP synthase subunit beta, partial [Mycoplasmoidaceae bacterium]|nr:F0F1 ATP synthase subunit beta [Mycoplasmoidaceae bacterium]
FFVAEKFSGYAGKYVKIADTIAGFKEIVEGRCDDIPEVYFYNVGTLEEVKQKVKNKLKTK